MASTLVLSPSSSRVVAERRGVRIISDACRVGDYQNVRLSATVKSVKRRDFIKIGSLGALGVGAARLLPGQDAAKADFTLRIAPVTVELAPTRVISTVGYNGTVPGPLLKMREGVPVTVDVINDT